MGTEMITATTPYLNLRRRDLAEVRKPQFAVGQVWLGRRRTFGDLRDGETIIAITGHPDTPIVTQSHFGSVSSYCADGRLLDDSDSEHDLVTLVRGAL